MDLISLFIALTFAAMFSGAVVLASKAEDVKACQTIMSMKANDKK